MRREVAPRPRNAKTTKVTVLQIKNLCELPQGHAGNAKASCFAIMLGPLLGPSSKKLIDQQVPFKNENSTRSFRCILVWSDFLDNELYWSFSWTTAERSLTTAVILQDLARLEIVAKRCAIADVVLPTVAIIAKGVSNVVAGVTTLHGVASMGIMRPM